MQHVVLYDGHCRFCVAGMRRLLALAAPDSLEAVDFQQPGALDRFPGLTPEACMRAMQLVTPDGRVYSGCEAGARALATRPVLGKLALVYYLPGLRQLCDAAYRWVAARRYRILGKTVAGGGCESGTCAVHFGKRNGA